MFTEDVLLIPLPCNEALARSSLAWTDDAPRDGWTGNTHVAAQYTASVIRQ